MAEIATPEFLSRMRSLYPKQPGGENGRWAMIVAIAFCASNLPEAVPLVFQYAVKDYTSHDDQLYLVRKIKDSLLKSAMLSGFPKVINALVELNTVLPDSLRETVPLRDLSMSTEALTNVGQEYFNSTYGETAESVQSLLREIYPDLEHFSTTFAYGYAYAFFKVVSAVETSFTMMSALIAIDASRQVGWHLKGAIRNGASIDEVRAVRQISIEVAQAAGVVWKNDIPDLET